MTSPEASSAAVGTRTSRAERREARSSEWKRLFSAPQGRHSKPPRRRTVLPLGRTGTTITVVLMLVGALGAAWLVAGFEPFTQLDVPALLALAP